jgi:hypothetical protein
VSENGRWRIRKNGRRKKGRGEEEEAGSEKKSDKKREGGKRRTRARALKDNSLHPEESKVSEHIKKNSRAQGFSTIRVRASILQHDQPEQVKRECLKGNEIDVKGKWHDKSKTNQRKIRERKKSE